MRRCCHVAVLVLAASCTTQGTTSTTSAATTAATTAITATTATARPETDQILEDLGASLCPDSEFTCVTLEMPLDHFDPSDPRTIPVTFAVLPATGRSQGAFVTATGGPGSSGIAVADGYTSTLDPAIPEVYDIVFFDQRGVAMSGGLSCPLATSAYYRVDPLTGLGLDEETLIEASSTFAEDCVVEAGHSEVLPHLGTDQAVADLELFRETLRYEEMVLYGESYGTQLSQTYAAAHGDHLTRMILDGTVDLTLEGLVFFEQQARAFGETLQSTLDHCAGEEACTLDLGMVPDQAYDRLIALLIEGPLRGDYPLPTGGLEVRDFGLGDLEIVASAQMYSEDDRMMFLRALAAYSGRDDLVPLLRLLYVSLGVDAVDQTVIEDPTYSDAVYYAVECLDYSYPGATPEETAEAFFAAGADLDVARLGTVFFGDLPCAFWPTSSKGIARPEPLVAPGIPTLVLGAEADPATPYRQGVDVAARLEEGYLITQQGGPHVVFGRGNPCPDEQVNAFILDGTAPEVTECEGEVVGSYLPLLPPTLDEFDSAESMFDAVELEIFYLPEYYWWDTVTDTPVGCHQGGTITFMAREVADGFVLDDCVLMEGLSLTGQGSYDWDEDVFTIDAHLGDPGCVYLYRRSGEEYTVEDGCPEDELTG